ncbi:MAG TPA: methionyl-tRNA formyltransferase [Steroidobacteraceae bacterium]|jgi:methionyl-tRNA formyltransferase|nr:methionyl-tRNA formyltransferase [Steroidobacteraceae bacterium]
MLRIAFAGTPQFALPALQALARSPHQLVGVLTQPDRPAGRGRAVQPGPVKQLAEQLALPVSQPARLATEEQRAQLRSWAPELLVVVAYGLILPAEVLALPPLGCVNVHASLLPRWRGAAPIQHAILAGDEASGVSIMQMRAGLDAGPVLATRSVPIGATVTAADLSARLAQLGAELLLGTLEAVQAGRARAHEQSEQDVTFAPKIDKQQAHIDWSQDAQRIARQVRAFNPWPVAQTTWRGTQLRIWEARAVQDPLVAPDPDAAAAAPGTVLAVKEDQLHVGCGRGVLAVTKLQLAGRRVLGAREFAGGAAPLGERLGA